MEKNDFWNLFDGTRLPVSSFEERTAYLNLLNMDSTSIEKK